MEMPPPNQARLAWTKEWVMVRVASSDKDKPPPLLPAWLWAMVVRCRSSVDRNTRIAPPSYTALLPVLFVFGRERRKGQKWTK